MENLIKHFLSGIILTPCCLFALGGQPEVVSGEAQYELQGLHEVVRVSDKAILHYKKFNLAENESTRFEQPSPKSTLLCRVKGKEASVLQGRLEANGKLLLINPSGIIFSKTAQVNVGTLIASTLDIQNDDFIHDRFRFTLSKESENSSIVNNGTIQGAHHVVLIAPTIRNGGVISAKAGKIAWLGGEVVTLDFDGDQKISFVVEGSLQQGLVDQAGQLLASEIYMKLPGAAYVVKNVLNTDGVVEAGHIEIKDGVVLLRDRGVTKAEEMVAQGRTVVIEGELQVASSCELIGQEKVIWKHENHVPHLKIKTDTLDVLESLFCEQWSSQISGQIILENSIHVQNNHLLLDAPVMIRAPEVLLATGEKEGSIRFLATVDAGMKGAHLKLSAGEGDIYFEKNVGESLPLSHLTITSAHDVSTKALDVGTLLQQEGRGVTQLDGSINASQKVVIQAHEIIQNEAVSSKKSVHYKADRIALGNHITTANEDIILDGPVTLIKNDQIHLSTGRFKGNVHLGPGLNADLPSRTLTISNGNGIVRFKGDIGTTGPLGQLTIEKSGQVIFQGDMGGSFPGITGCLNVKSVATECQGSIYNVGELLWDASKLRLTSPNTVEFKTRGLPMHFQGRDLILEKTSGFTIHTHGGRLDLMSITTENSQPITIYTGDGEAHLTEIGKKVSSLQVEGRSILLGGHLEADRIILESEERLEYEHPTVGNIIQTAIKSSGPITFNSKQGAVGTPNYPLNIETSQDCFVGAKAAAYLQGVCADQMPHVYSQNPPPSLFFNGYEYRYLFIDEAQANEELINSLLPALTHNIPTSIMDGSIIRARKAPMYYQVPK